MSIAELDPAVPGEKQGGEPSSMADSLSPVWQKRKGKKQMKKMAMLITGLALWATAVNAQIVESRIGGTEAVAIPNGVATEVTHITLDCGTWLISGEVNLYQAGQSGQVFAAANIGLHVAVSTDGTTNTYGIQRSNPQAGTVVPLSLPSRLVRFNSNNTPVYLVAFSAQTTNGNPQAIAWGFISAQRVGDY
jgi:hypothetical protein